MTFSYFKNLIDKRKLFLDSSLNLEDIDFGDNDLVSARCRGKFPDMVIKNGAIIEVKDLVKGGNSIEFNSEKPRAKKVFAELPKNVQKQMISNGDTNQGEREVFYLCRQVKNGFVKVACIDGLFYHIETSMKDILLGECREEIQDIINKSLRNKGIEAEAKFFKTTISVDYGPVSERLRLMFSSGRKNNVFKMLKDNTLNFIFICKSDEDRNIRLKEAATNFENFEVNIDGRCLIFSKGLYD